MLDVLRRELKYQVSEENAARIKSRLSYVLSKDLHDKGEGYMVRSLYFDTVTNTAFYEKQAGTDYRRKVRLRVYSANDETAKLELKEKQGNFQRKRSLLVHKAEAEELLAGRYGVLKDKGEFGYALYSLMCTEGYRPVCIVQYIRQAYISRTNDIRITFDQRLSANEGRYDLFDPCLRLYPAGMLGSTIMEVKYNHFLLSYIKDVLSQADQMPVSSSKYCQCRLLGLGGAL